MILEHWKENPDNISMDDITDFAYVSKTYPYDLTVRSDFNKRDFQDAVGTLIHEAFHPHLWKNGTMILEGSNHPGPHDPNSGLSGARDLSTMARREYSKMTPDSSKRNYARQHNEVLRYMTQGYKAR